MKEIESGQLMAEKQQYVSQINNRPPIGKKLKKHWRLYVLIAPAIIFFAIFNYFPMYGVIISFKDYVATKGIWGSSWVGFKHFERFFHAYNFWELIRNTFFINIYQLAMFPVSIIVALSINEVRNSFFKKSVQTITYAPHFISVVVMTGMIVAFLSPSTGIINKGISLLGFEPIAFLAEPGWFKTIFVQSGVWQGLGWSAIIYLAALAGVNPELHEAARVDGASRFQRIIHINIPAIIPVMVILLILDVGNLLSVGFEKIYLLQNPLNMEASDVIQTYVYRAGLLEGQYSFSAAVGLFNSIVTLILLIIVNYIARRTTNNSLW
ncbi:sugar ABC transporter permease [Lederbergia ruris]|nr:putative aldouronate transport system permease protein [Lederbergia galactosidilytica]GIN59063.1 sugar ABC transporter permease [Lederbergia ruris]